MFAGNLQYQGFFLHWKCQTAVTAYFSSNQLLLFVFAVYTKTNNGNCLLFIWQLLLANLASYIHWYEKIHTGRRRNETTTRLADLTETTNAYSMDLCISHHMKSSPKGSGLMWYQSISRRRCIWWGAQGTQAPPPPLTLQNNYNFTSIYFNQPLVSSFTAI